ncbi:hypothetical protein V6N11_081436 [Hibiscus sabdariffa]|uniref:Uncharacterized protein n=1 Tax=Hibiscus sabdariffa TaxID=183260 RepID=A0ABR2N6E0_9ROSI
MWGAWFQLLVLKLIPIYIPKRESQLQKSNKLLSFRSLASKRDNSLYRFAEYGSLDTKNPSDPDNPTAHPARDSSETISMFTAQME